MMIAAIKENGNVVFPMAKVSFYILSQECSRQKVTNHASACSKIMSSLDNLKFLYRILIIRCMLIVSVLFHRSEEENLRKEESLKASITLSTQQQLHLKFPKGQHTRLHINEKNYEILHIIINVFVLSSIIVIWKNMQNHL